MFPAQKFDKPVIGLDSEPQGPPRRLNTVAGAAIAAAVLGRNIDYAGALDTLLDKSGVDTQRVARAGLLPLVLRYRENELLSLPYFKKVEDRLEREVQ